MDFFPKAFKYLNAWLLMGFTLFAAIAAEKLWRTISTAVVKRTGAGNIPIPRGIRTEFRLSVTLPESATISMALYSPALAAAAVVTVCASLPFCTFIPIIDNGADIIQTVQFMILSEVFALISLYALHSAEAIEMARIEMRAMLRLFVPLTACLASLASYFIKHGLDSDPFSLNSFIMAGHFGSMSAWGVTGVLLFIFIIMSQIPHRSILMGTSLLLADDLPEYGGAPRAMLQMWSIFRSFIVTSVAVHIVFPTEFIANAAHTLGISWRVQALNFAAFWLSVMFARLIVFPLCGTIVGTVEERLPRAVRALFIPILTIVAMLLLLYEGILLSQEAASF